MLRVATLALQEDQADNTYCRHIEVGDGLQMMIVDKEGVHEIYVPLKKD